MMTLVPEKPVVDEVDEHRKIMDSVACMLQGCILSLVAEGRAMQGATFCYSQLLAKNKKNSKIVYVKLRKKSSREGVIHPLFLHLPFPSPSPIFI